MGIKWLELRISLGSSVLLFQAPVKIYILWKENALVKKVSASGACVFDSSDGIGSRVIWAHPHWSSLSRGRISFIKGFVYKS